MSGAKVNGNAPGTPAYDPVIFRIIDAMEKYVEDGTPRSDNTKREMVAAYLSGLMTAAQWTDVRPGHFHIFPAVLQEKALVVARRLGMAVDDSPPPCQNPSPQPPS